MGAQNGSISTEADNNINPDILKNIRTGSEKINELIKVGDLVFDKNTKTLKERKRVKPFTDVYGTYIWHWYGFDFVMDAQNSGIISAKLYQYAAVLGTGGVVADGVIPGVVVFTTVAAGVLSYWGAVASEGSYGAGSIAFFFGDPSWAQLYSVQVR